MDNLIEQTGLNTDATIIEKIVKGDLSLFEILIRRYNPVLYKIARSHGFNHQDAEDLMQEAHISAYQNLSKFEGRSSYKTWVSKIIVNKCLYKLKYGYFKNEIPSGEIQQPDIKPLLMKPRETGPEEKLIGKELAMVLEKSLQMIPVMYRTVFVLRVVEGFSVAETSELLQITSANVKVRLNRAKVLLQQEIERFYTHKEIYSFNLIYCDVVVKRVFDRIKHPDLS